MAINVYLDRIEFIEGSNVYTLTETVDGFDFSGVISSDGFSSFQGTVAGFNASGFIPPGFTVNNTIDKFPFAYDVTASDYEDLSIPRYYGSSHSSSTHGYTSGGGSGGFGVQQINKYSFTQTGAQTTVGLLSSPGAFRVAGFSSTTNGYTFTADSDGTTNLNVIDRFPFASDINGLEVGALPSSFKFGSQHSSATHGYVAGGTPLPSVPTTVNNIQKFPFASEGGGIDAADLSAATSGAAGQSSTSHGYSSGGQTASSPSTITNSILKFSFVADTNSSDVADLTTIRINAAGISSISSGYTTGGATSPTSIVNTIDKFPFSSNSTASDVGDLTVARSGLSGTQY